MRKSTLMMDSSFNQARQEPLRYCVIIPTFNNAATLKGVIEDVMSYTHDIIVVNDGSTDETENILRLFPAITSIGYSRNAGKGWALRQGFARALELGYLYAISMDSDGQHFARDLPTFINYIAINGDALLVGARNMDQDAVPGKSNFGNRFSNFWFTLETGVRCPDTQSGFRLYPIALLRNMKFFTKKYEFEIEVLVRASWHGIPVRSVPVSVYYPPPGERISHFRPFADFARISVLNSILVIVAFLYIKPRNFFRIITDKKKFKKLVDEELLHPRQSDQLKAASIGFGVFMGIIPIWGFQLVAAIFLALVLKLNKPLVIIAANISIPPMIPLVIFCSYKTGAVWMGGVTEDLVFSRNISLQSVRSHFQQYLLGSMTLALAAGLISAMLAFILLKLVKRKPVLAG